MTYKMSLCLKISSKGKGTQMQRSPCNVPVLGGRGKAPPIQSRCKKGLCGQRHALTALPAGRGPYYPLYRLGGPQGKSWQVWRRENPCPQTGSKPGSSSCNKFVVLAYKCMWNEYKALCIIHLDIKMKDCEFLRPVVLALTFAQCIACKVGPRAILYTVTRRHAWWWLCGWNI